MRAAEIAVQLTLWLGVLVVLAILTAERRATWRAARARRRAPRRAARVHIGDTEHPIGSTHGCPGCDSWRDRRQRHAIGPVVRLANVERTRVDGRWRP